MCLTSPAAPAPAPNPWACRAGYSVVGSDLTGDAFDAAEEMPASLTRMVDRDPPCYCLPTFSQAGWHGASIAERSPAHRGVARQTECGQKPPFDCCFEKRVLTDTVA